MGYKFKGQGEKMYQLKNALYGHKKVPRAWYSRIDRYFNKIGLEKSLSEPNLYIKTGEANVVLIVSLYVDDLIYSTNCVALMEVFKRMVDQ